MNFFEKIRETIMKFFRTDAEKEFNVEFITSSEIENSQQKFRKIPLPVHSKESMYGFVSEHNWFGESGFY